MEHFPLWAQIAALVALLLISAFFSMAETAMMALSRLRLRHLVRQGSVAGRRTQQLLDRTDRLLSVILIGNSFANAAITALFTALTLQYFGNGHWNLAIATVSIAFTILVFSEVTPKVIGASYPEPLALFSSAILKALSWLATPAVWFVNLFVHAILRVLRIPGAGAITSTRLTPEEMRTAVLESGSFIRGKHRTMLLNLFDLEQLTVDDVMAPRAAIEALDIEQPILVLIDQLTSCYHNKLVVYEGDISRVLGVLHVRKLPAVLTAGPLTHEAIRELLAAPYYVPTGTSLLQQLQMFQENRQRLGLVVDEYGELVGLVTVDDIVEEIVGEFTTPAPGTGQSGLRWGPSGQIVVDGAVSLRLLNRRLGLSLPLDGPKTLNGLILEQLEQIPDGPCCLRLPGCVLEIVQVQDQAVRSVRLIRTASG
ncbi:MAG TPA: CNNM domain-containing protein [Burkholderiaceae bacterium]|nr:CNNM domain-containing protein [Burkholderiaceae bacterium]